MKVYTFCLPAPHWGEGHVCGFALSETGDLISTHVSSNREWSRADMSNPYHAKDIEAYPGGPHEVEWVDDPEAHQGLAKARALNKQRALEPG